MPSATKLTLDVVEKQFQTCDFSLGCELNVSQENIENARSHSEWYTIGNTNYLLVDFNHFDLPTHMDSVLSEFISLGLLPIIAHPERNSLLQRRIDLLEEASEYRTNKFGWLDRKSTRLNSSHYN